MAKKLICVVLAVALAISWTMAVDITSCNNDKDNSYQNPDSYVLLNDVTCIGENSTFISPTPYFAGTYEVDCQGHTIFCDGCGGGLVYELSRHNFTMRNCNFLTNSQSGSILNIGSNDIVNFMLIDSSIKITNDSSSQIQIQTANPPLQSSITFQRVNFFANFSNEIFSIQFGCEPTNQFSIFDSNFYTGYDIFSFAYDCANYSEVIDNGSIGNYYEIPSYTCIDANNNNFCDSPFIYSMYNNDTILDNHPLSSPTPYTPDTTPPLIDGCFVVNGNPDCGLNAELQCNNISDQNIDTIWGTIDGLPVSAVNVIGNTWKVVWNGINTDEFNVSHELVLYANDTLGNEANSSVFTITEMCLVCVPDWSCTGYGVCNISDERPCISATDLNVCGENYTGDYSEFMPLACDYCTPAWVCSGLGLCNGSIQPCLSVNDTNNCSEAFNGTLSTYDVNCGVFQYTNDDIPEVAWDGIFKFIYAFVSLVAIFAIILLYKYLKRNIK